MEKAFQICIEMFIQRGYNISETEEFNKIIAIKSDGSQVCSFMSYHSKFNVTCIQNYISIMHDMNINHIIIIYKNSVTPMAKKIVESSQDIIVELFSEDEMQYNITKHRLVPTHQKLPDNEAEQFKKEFGIRLPVILKTDPVARFYAYKRGDVIKIIRNNGYITYRIVKG